MEFYGGYQVYAESGVDLTLLRENLNRTVAERIDDNARSLAVADAFEESGRTSGSHSHNRPRFNMLDPGPMLRQLIDHDVKVVLIGGLAMVAHGSAYITKDIDLCYGRSKENLEALTLALAPLHPTLRGAPPDLPFRLDVPTLAAGLNFTLSTDLGALDLLGEVTGIGGYELALAQSDERHLGPLTVRVLSVDGLIVNKRAAGRPKDLNHVLELVELKKLLDAEDEDRRP